MKTVHLLNEERTRTRTTETMKKTNRVLLPLAVLPFVVSWFVATKVKAVLLNHALCLAASQEDTATVERLLRRGASPNAVDVVPSPNLACDTRPQSALSLAVDSPSTKGFRAMGPRGVTEYNEAMSTVALLVQAGADVNARDEDSSTALIEAKSPPMVRLLLAHGAKVNLRGNGGITALMAHADYFSVDETRALLAAGADANARDSHGETAMMLALQQSTDPDLDPYFGPGQVSIVTLGVVERLIAAGAAVNARDNQGKTALWYARENKQTDSISFLKKIGARL